MDSEDSQDAARRSRSSSSSSTSSDGGPASPAEHDGFDRPPSPRDRSPSIEREDSTNDRGDSSSRDGPKSPPEPGPYSPDNMSQPRSPMSYNSGPNSPKSPLSRRSDSNSRNSSVKSPLSSSGSPNVRQSRSPKSPKSPESDRLSRNSNSQKSDGHLSDSSQSSRDSSLGRSRPPEPPTEEISDCDIESDHKTDNEDQSESIDKGPSTPRSTGSIRSNPKSPNKSGENNINLSHEYLSDVSDLDSPVQSEDEEDDNSKPIRSPIQAPKVTDLRQKLDEAKHQKGIEKNTSPEKRSPPQNTNKTDDGEEALDFEAEEGECQEAALKPLTEEIDKPEAIKEPADEGELEDGEELEEGEVTDGDENRPEETEPRPVCRFFARGQCTWGVSCRFLHPGVTDKGNYTMFDMVRPVAGPPGIPPGYGPPLDFRAERPHLFPGAAIPRVAGGADPPVIESAWERGLRTAKEMMRKANKRKEQDMDFEEKKMNLTLGQDDIERENGYYARAATPPRTLSPEPPYTIKPRHIPHEIYPPRKEEFYRRLPYDEPPRLVRVEPEYVDFPPGQAERERPRYRELPAHRMPHYEDHGGPIEGVLKRRPRPTREVIVQRAEVPTRGDEWADPWMRSKSPGARKGRERSGRRSYSSGSSYSGSSTTRSSSSGSNTSRSRSRSPRHSSRRSNRSRPRPVSPSVIVSEKRAASERALLMNPPAPSPRKRPHSPAMMRRSAQNPPAPTSKMARLSSKAQAKTNSRDGTTDAFGRTRRDVDRLMTERSRHEASSRSGKPTTKQPYKAGSESVRRRRDGKSSSSGTGSSESSSSDTESSYSSSSSSREHSPSTRRGLNEQKKVTDPKAIDKSKNNAKIPTERKKEDSRKVTDNTKKRTVTSPIIEETRDKPSANKAPSPTGGKKQSRREELLKQLKAVEDAIARKRSKIN